MQLIIIISTVSINIIVITIINYNNWSGRLQRLENASTNGGQGTGTSTQQT